MSKSSKKIQTTEKVPCALCGRINNQPFMNLHDPIKQNGISYTLVKCPDCDLIYLNPRPVLQSGPENHPEEYWEKKNLSQQTDNHSILTQTKKLFLRLLFAEELAHIKRGIPQGGRILEIGCGNGDFLAMLKESGYHTVGIEPDPVSFKVAKEKHDDLELYNATIESAQFKPKSFDAIVMIHVFEHIANPNQALKEIRRILTTNGKLFIFIPNVDCYQFKFFKNRYFNLCAPQHLYLYSPHTLQKLLKKHGLIAVHISHQSIRCNSATLVCSLFPRLNPVSLAIRHKEKGIWLKQLLAHLLTVLLIPVTFLEGFLGHGANMFVLARKETD